MLILIDALDQCVTTKGATSWERIMSHVRAYKLDRDLAAGASPESSAVLALRAQTLVRSSMRRALARSIGQLFEEATRGCTPGFAGARIPIRRNRIMAAADALQMLIDRLVMPGPVPARGVAAVRVLLTDGAGPLYYPGSSDDLSAVVLNLVEQLEQLNSW